MNIAAYLPGNLFTGKTVFITGGGSGINLGIAKNFAVVGADIAICGRTPERLEGAAGELRGLGGKVSARRSPTCATCRHWKRRSPRPRRNWDRGGAGVWGSGKLPVPAEELSANGFKTVIETLSGPSTPPARPSSSLRRPAAASSSYRRVRQ